MAKTALVVGSSGIVGRNLASRLLAHGWTVHGLARRPATDLPGLKPLAADLQDPATLGARLAEVQPTHVFLATWLRQDSEKENIRVNGAMVKNLLAAVAPGKTVEHVALVTGLKHYLGPFESYGKGTLPATPFRESQPRLDVDNFYYAQEDEMYAAARSSSASFGWSVHRPHTIVGYAGHQGSNAMNMGVTLAVYASLCRELAWPFVFPGSAVQWSSLTDMTDARLLAAQLEWAATTPAARNQAFNVVNGDVFRWSWMWGRIAQWFGLEPAPLSGGRDGVPLAKQMVDADAAWKTLADKRGLVEADMGKLASPWHTDADLGRPIEVVTDMSKSRKLGFLDYQATDDSFFDLFTKLREARVIP
jgi:nucleoside-diphosphate-sugar epimerase